MTPEKRRPAFAMTTAKMVGSTCSSSNELQKRRAVGKGGLVKSRPTRDDFNIEETRELCRVEGELIQTQSWWGHCRAGAGSLSAVA